MFLPWQGSHWAIIEEGSKALLVICFYKLLMVCLFNRNHRSIRNFSWTCVPIDSHEQYFLLKKVLFFFFYLFNTSISPDAYYSCIQFQKCSESREGADTRGPLGMCPYRSLIHANKALIFTFKHCSPEAPGVLFTLINGANRINYELGRHSQQLDFFHS